MKQMLLITLAVLFLLAACKEKPLDLTKPVYVTVSTNMGDVTVLLYEDTPLHRDNFIKLCQSNEYEGMIFHRVIKDFVVQGGDPSSKERVPGKLYGDGDGGYTVPAEILPKYFNKRGALIDAKEMDADNPERASAGTQFCFVQGKVHTDEELDQRESRINDIHKNWLHYKFLDQLKKENPDADLDSLETQASVMVFDKIAEDGPIKIPADRREYYKTIGGVPHLDGSLTIFGEVTEGFDIVEKMSLVQTDKNDRPEKDIVILATKVFN
ncbi:cyclophilin family peptidyl-prolyl cis-trans isomerase [Parabacteroides sp. PF5-5]|uniref:peptidylprolyl isomerase n=1 Tax=unclassified Parabacteroides TaxID=2649774 RepID=UPI002475A00C|nr:MULTISPECIES: peptidylprolyl isomerase [unclassified Parabacteroides]MDH6305797.1 cyclophilin family peptidyl-prolyl cis-trans isomerase [Parabacteroides sp. PH5-39]MDH6317766.1 cyclophilin family peptidyl-prolyl cis-trans isomerase [Parabacteroides sp. PF5-13]MDH6320597.1 cyclophilin family peptidyl-prolyl cis-trans isomerase [Parabacteroides sp. PH5-13]MDH6324240.1 cyclophilin family peptidyl-prolyl cis-trans isomerase [Parabacteroides sp. PH5-8]MDH6328951.1 cyclophilin family peptidyl-pr